MFDNDEVENQREAEIIGNFLQGAQDYLDLLDHMGNYEESREPQFEYNKVIAELEQVVFPDGLSGWKSRINACFGH